MPTFGMNSTVRHLLQSGWVSSLKYKYDNAFYIITSPIINNNYFTIEGILKALPHGDFETTWETINYHTNSPYESGTFKVKDFSSDQQFEDLILSKNPHIYLLMTIAPKVVEDVKFLQRMGNLLCYCYPDIIGKNTDSIASALVNIHAGSRVQQYDPEFKGIPKE